MVKPASDIKGFDTSIFYFKFNKAHQELSLKLLQI